MAALELGTFGSDLHRRLRTGCGYSFVVKKGGLKESAFFEPSPYDEAVSLDEAKWLEIIWSWVGASTLFVASLALVNHSTTVMWWSVEALLLIGAGFYVQRIGYRVQGLTAIALSCGKLLAWNHQNVSFSNAVQYGVVGATAMIASFLYFREERRRTAPVVVPADPAVPAAATLNVVPSPDPPESHDEPGLND